ncbi:hypothetical protein QAD02_012983 [Eretmocerus hayati]|uniref:Uncharacterized protein n=1 Tax=Eretmocerus hayati TaxID=131215 RepID=A0ACC2P198_9HYME|nr:hypothetical protein QAD02_012983 [Eretmocerus hayati]
MDHFLRLLKQKGIDIKQISQPTTTSQDKIGLAFEDGKYVDLVTRLYGKFQNRISDTEFKLSDCTLKQIEEIAGTHYKSGVRPGNIKALQNFLVKYSELIKSDLTDYSTGTKHFVALGQRLINEYLGTLADIMTTNPKIAHDVIAYLYENKTLESRSHRYLRSLLYGEEFALPKNVDEFDRRLKHKREIILRIQRLALSFSSGAVNNRVHDSREVVESQFEILVKADAIATALVIDAELLVFSHKVDENVSLGILQHEEKCRKILDLYKKDKDSVIKTIDDLMQIIRDAKIFVSRAVMKWKKILVGDYFTSMHPSSAINIQRCQRFKFEHGNGLQITAKEAMLENLRVPGSLGYLAVIPRKYLKEETEIKDFSIFRIDEIDYLYLGVDSFANHDCDPVTKYRSGKRTSPFTQVHLKTIQKVKKGSELTVSYSRRYFVKGDYRVEFHARPLVESGWSKTLKNNIPILFYE